MARYIDCDKAVGIGYLSDWYQASIDDTKPPIWTDEHLEELTNDFIIIPKDTPTAKVKEVKYGKWTILGLRNPQCSLCHKYNYEESNYCPNCGAIMDGKDEVK